MLTTDDILASLKKAPSKPDEAAQRQLPYKKAFILGRQSSQGQVRDHKEALLEIAALVDLAKNDGYQTSIEREEVENLLLSIRDGRANKDILQDGDVRIDLRDLGLSASRDPEKRQGLIAFRTRTEAGEIGCLYVTDTSRITRDPTRIEPYQLIQLMIDHHCRVRTPEGIWNPAIERDWEYLTAELEDAGKESKKLRRILHRKKLQKASRGEWVGNAVPAGFYLPMEGKQPSGKYMFKKYAIHEAHAAVATRILEEFNRHEGSPHATLKALHNQDPPLMEFPFFPSHLEYMESRSALRCCPRTTTGYRITPGVIKGLATNPAMIGIFTYGDMDPIPNNHDPAVPTDIWLRAKELAKQKGKPKGRATYYEPLPLAGLLQCCNHDEPVRMSGRSSDGEYRCQRDYERRQGSTCIAIKNRFLDEPVTSKILQSLDFSMYAEEVLAKLETESDREKAYEANRKRDIRALERKRDDMQSRLLQADDERLIKLYEEQYTTLNDMLDELQATPSPSEQKTATDFATVKQFLANLNTNWDRYSDSLRHQLLKLLIDRVDIRHQGENIDATIFWKTGMQQQLWIHRPGVVRSQTSKWTAQEEQLLKMLWPSSSPEVLEKAFPGRTWMGISTKAIRMKIQRKVGYERPDCHPRWIQGDEEQARKRYEAGDDINEIAIALNRTPHAILKRATKGKWYRPPEVKWKKAEVKWETSNFSRLQESSSPALSGVLLAQPSFRHILSASDNRFVRLPLSSCWLLRL